MAGLDPENIEYLNDVLTNMRHTRTVFYWCLAIAAAFVIGSGLWVLSVSAWGKLRAWWSRQLRAPRPQGW